MALRTAEQVVRLSAVIPCGEAGFWRIIRALDAKSAWTISDVHGETTGQPRHLKGIRNYVSALVKGGFARVASEIPNARGGGATKFYRLVKKPAEAPALRSDGSIVPVSAQQRIWNAMRTLRQFTADELAFTAAIGKRVLPRVTVERYLTDLNAAGYLVGGSTVPRGQAVAWRLKPAMNTGPMAPKILALHVVFDANRQTVITPDAVVARGVSA